MKSLFLNISSKIIFFLTNLRYEIEVLNGPYSEHQPQGFVLKAIVNHTSKYLPEQSQFICGL